MQSVRIVFITIIVVAENCTQVGVSLLIQCVVPAESRSSISPVHPISSHQFIEDSMITSTIERKINPVAIVDNGIEFCIYIIEVHFRIRHIIIIAKQTTRHSRIGKPCSNQIRTFILLQRSLKHHL